MPAASTPRWSHHTALPAEPASASRARAFVSRHLTEHRLLKLVDPVRLVASELATNALVHQTEFTITLSGLDELVLLSVRDGFPPPAASTVPEPRSAADRGLRLVALVSRDWGVAADASGARIVWASFPRPPARQP
jgi:anti-sigma regulatory factor (Ser/Thr protein kinase)